jgi:hypothetical protein
VPVITIPLNTGCNEQVDQRLMTDGRLRTVRNGRVDREGRIRVRNGYTAVDERIVNVSGDEMVAYDLATYRGRMVALGDSSNDAVGYPTSVFDWIDGVRPWRRVMPSGQNLPRLTGMREVIGSEGSIAIASHAAAACNDRLMLSYGATTESVIMVQPSTGRVLFIDDADEGSGRIARNIQMCETDAKIIVVGQNAATASARFLYGYSLDATSRFMADGDIATALIDAGLGNTIADWALSRVAGSEHFVIVAELSTGAVVTRLFTAAGVNVVPSGGQFADITANPTDVAIEADSVSNTVNVAMIVAGAVQLTTFNLTTGAEVGVGPHTSANMGAATALPGMYLVRASATSVIVVANISDAVADKVGLESYNPAANTFDTTNTTYLEDAVLHAQPAYHAGEVVVAIRHDGISGFGPVLVLSVTLSAAANDVTLLASVDLDLWGVTRGRIFEDQVTGKWYWNRLYSLGTVNERDRCAVTEFDLDWTGRRQMVEAGNLLYLSGGLPLVYDGVACVEMGFADHPRIIDSAASNSGGQMDSSATYTYGYHYQDTDARGNIVFSSVADPEEVVMGATDDTVVLTLSRPYSLRCNLSSDLWKGSVFGLAFRNTNDLVDAVTTPSALLQWNNNTFTASSANAQGDPGVDVGDGFPDSTIEESTVIYTQARTILDNRPPRPCTLMAFDGTRMMTNTPRSEHWRASKPLATEEQVTFAREGVLAFQGSTPSDIEAIVAYAQSWLLITRRDMWALNGGGPNVNGIPEFQTAYRIPSDGGMRAGGWVSVCVFGKGVLFQLEDDQLYLWAGGQPKPVGLEIQDTLEEFPNVVATCHIARQQAVALALQNDAGDDGCIVIWDQQRGHWYRDDVGVVTSMAEHDGRLAYIQGGVVYLEDDDYGEGTAVPLTISTGNVAKTGAAGASGIQLIHLVGVFQDECTAEMRIKYTDDVSFTSLGVQTLNTASGYSTGEPFDLEWQPPRDDGSRYELELVVTSSATDTKLAWLNAIEVHYDIDDGPTRVGDARRR